MSETVEPFRKALEARQTLATVEAGVSERESLAPGAHPGPAPAIAKDLLLGRGACGALQPAHILRLQRVHGNQAVNRLIGTPHPGDSAHSTRVRSTAAPPLVQREDALPVGRDPVTSPLANGPSSTAASLQSVITMMERIHAQAAQALGGEPGAGAAERGVTPPAQHLVTISDALDQLRTIASGTDEGLKQRALAAFSPAAIRQAQAQAEAQLGSVEAGGRAQPAFGKSPVGALIDAQPIVQRLVAMSHRPGPEPTGGFIQRQGAAAVAAALTAFELAGGGEVEAVTGPPGWLVGAVIGIIIVGALAVAAHEATQGTTVAMAVQGPRASGQLTNVARHLARLLALGAVGGVPSGEPPKNDNRNDNHWWTEIKASIREFLQALKGGSRRQIMRELLKRGWTEEQILEVEAKLAEAARLMGEDPPQLLPPP